MGSCHFICYYWWPIQNVLSIIIFCILYSLYISVSSTDICERRVLSERLRREVSTLATLHPSWLLCFSSQFYVLCSSKKTRWGDLIPRPLGTRDYDADSLTIRPRHPFLLRYIALLLQLIFYSQRPRTFLRFPWKSSKLKQFQTMKAELIIFCPI